MIVTKPDLKIFMDFMNDLALPGKSGKHWVAII